MTYTLLATHLSMLSGYSTAEVVRDGPVRAELIARHLAVVPGQEVDVAVRLVMDDGWHTYWKNPGESGMPTSLRWQLPAGFAVGDIRWPAPSYYEVAGLASYGYSGEVLLPVKLQAPPQWSGDEVTLEATADWLVCETTCVPGSAALSLTLPVHRGDASVAEDPEHAERFARSDRRAVMLPVHESTSAPPPGRVLTEGDRYVLTLDPRLSLASASEWPDARFFPAEPTLIDMGATQASSLNRQGGLTLGVARHPFASGPAERFAGVLVWSDPSGRTPDRIFEIDLPIRDAAAGE